MTKGTQGTQGTKGTKGTKGTNTVGHGRMTQERCWGGLALGGRGRDFKLEISNLKDGVEQQI